MRLHYVIVYTGIGGGGCPCCEAGCADATCCTSCTELFGNLPSELAIFALFFIFLLACVGAMVAVFVGTLYIGKVISSHVHLLQKESLARDYIVADLDDLGSSSNGTGSGNNILTDDQIDMTSLSPIHCIEATLGSSSSASASLSHQQDDNSGYSSIHTDQIASTYPYPPERQREHQSSTAGGSDSIIMYSSIRRRSEVNRTLSEAQRRELTALGLM